MVEYNTQDVVEFRYFCIRECNSYYNQKYEGKSNADKICFPNFSNNKLNDLFSRNYPVISKLINLAVDKNGKVESFDYSYIDNKLLDYNVIMKIFIFMISLENVDSEMIFDKKFLTFMAIFSISIESDINMIWSLLLVNEKEKYYETIGNIFSSNECNLWLLILKQFTIKIYQKLNVMDLIYLKRILKMFA